MHLQRFTVSVFAVTVNVSDQIQSRKELMLQFKTVRQEEFPFTFRWVSFYVLLSAPTDEMRPTSTGKSNLLYSVSWFTCLSHQKHHKRWIKFHQMSRHLGPCTPWSSWYIKLTITGTSRFISICVQIKTMHCLLAISLIPPTNIHELLLHAKVYVFLYSIHSSSLSEKTLFASFTILAEERIITLFFSFERHVWKNIVSGLCVLLSKVFQTFWLADK